MTQPAPKLLPVQVDLEAEALEGCPTDPLAIAGEMKLLWLVNQVRLQRLSYPKAARIAGLPVASFLRVLGDHKVGPLEVPPEELDRQIQDLRAARLG